MTVEAAVGTDQWLLRAPGGQEYGPVAFETLRAWAAQNRFTAGYSVSANRADWRAVESIPELGMDWFVEPGDGNRYGPFHPLALLDYVREGAVPPETKVTHKANGGQARAYQVLLEAFVDAIDQTGEVQGELVQQIQALHERLEERDRWFQEESRRLQEEREKRQEIELAVRRLEEQARPLNELKGRMARLEAELAQARAETEAERKAHQESRARLEESARRENAEAVHRVAELEQKSAALLAVTEGCKRDLDRMAGRQAQEREAREIEKRSLVEQGRLTAETLKQSYERRQAEMEARLQSQAAAEARVREELSVVRASLKADESGVQQELLKSREESHRQKRELDARLQEAETRAAESAASASRAEAELALLKGRSERALQAREAEQAQIESRVISAGGELEAAKAQLKAAEAERALLRGQLEKERKARAEDQAAMAARAEGEIQHREALEALTHEVTALRRDKADLTHRLDSVRARAEENAQADREVAQLRGTLVSVKKEQAESETRARQRLAEIDERLGHAVRAGEEAVREAAAGRDRIRLLESRLAENARPSARPAWAAGPVIDAPMADSAPQDRPVSEPRPAAEPRSAPDPVRVPPRKAGSLAGLEAQAQAELKAWQEKKQVPPAVENPPRNKSWLPWKKS